MSRPPDQFRVQIGDFVWLVSRRITPVSQIFWKLGQGQFNKVVAVTRSELVRHQTAAVRVAVLVVVALVVFAPEIALPALAFGLT